MLDDLLMFFAMFVQKATWWFQVIMRSDKQLHEGSVTRVEELWFDFGWPQAGPFAEMKWQ